MDALGSPIVAMEDSRIIRVERLVAGHLAIFRRYALVESQAIATLKPSLNQHENYSSSASWQAVNVVLICTVYLYSDTVQKEEQTRRSTAADGSNLIRSMIFRAGCAS